MKRFPHLPLTWGRLLFVTLLLVLSVAALLTDRRLEREAASIEADSVPGLINAHTMRTAFSEGFTCLTLALAETDPAARQELLQRMTEWDAKARVAADEYRKTIHIDPAQDSANLHAVLAARDEYVTRRDEFVGLLGAAPTDRVRQNLNLSLVPSYRRLIHACEALESYNGRTGELIADEILSIAGRLRWTVAAVILLGIAIGLGMREAISRNARTERALRESEEKFSTSFQVSPHAMVISLRSNGRIVEANQAFRRQYDLGDVQIVGKTAVELGLWGSDAARETLMQRIREHGASQRNFLFHRTLPNGKRRSTLLSTEPLHLSGEECLLAVAQDISELLDTQQAHAQSLTEMRVLIENAAIGMALVNPEGRLIRSNPALERFLGYSGEELGRMTFPEFTHADDVQQDVDQFQRVLRGELDYYEMEKRYVRKDRAIVVGHLSVSVMRHAGGSIAYVIGMITDITERRRAELALRESEATRQNLERQLVTAQKFEALGQLAGGVAHDFNNMLAAMMFYLDLLKQEAALSPAMKESLDELTQSAKRAAGLTRQLLLFSRGEPAQRQVVDLNVVVANLLRMLGTLVGEHFELVHAPAPQPLWLNADVGMLEQVVMNLVVNARDAMPRGGRIVLQVRELEVDANLAAKSAHGRPGRFGCLTVADRGCGMSPATLAKIFEPFFTTKEAGKGTGLGLATVFGIVRQHSGWINVESVVDQGSTFFIYLPVHSGAAAGRPVAGAAVGNPRGRETILVAEDNDHLRVVTARILRHYGYQVLEAATGRAARELLDAHPGKVDLLLTDVVMPGGLLGHEVAANLPSGAAGPKIILMSGHAIQPGTFESDHLTYLRKPFDTSRLLGAVRGVLDGPAA